MSNNRKILLINPKFQLTFMAHVAWISFFVLSVIYAANTYFFFTFKAQGKSIGLPPTHMFFKFIERQQTSMDIIFIVLAVIVLLVICIGGLYISHRIAGPLYKLNKHMKEVASGETDREVSFRKHDYFQELATTYNEQLKKLKE